MNTITNSTKQAVISKTIVRDDNGTPTGVRFECVNGEKVTFSLSSLNETLYAEAAAHGISQKLGDATAISRNPDTGKSATPDDKWDALVEVYNRLTIDGLWNAVREGGGNAGGLLFRALCRMYPAKAPADLKTWLEGKSKDEQAAMRKNPKIAAVIAEIQSEKVDESIDTDAMLEELGDADESDDEGSAE